MLFYPIIFYPILSAAVTHRSLVGSAFDPLRVHTMSRSLSFIMLKAVFTYASTIVYVIGSTFMRDT